MIDLFFVFAGTGVVATLGLLAGFLVAVGITHLLSQLVIWLDYKFMEYKEKK